MSKTLSLRVALIAMLAYSIIGLAPLVARAQNVDEIGNAQCLQEVMRRASMKPPIPPPPSPPFACAGVYGAGHCMGAICKAETAAGLGGIGNTLSQGLSSAVSQLISGALQKLLSGGQGGSGSGGGSGAGGSGYSTPGCTQTQTQDFNVYASNPSCYTYVAPVSSSLNGGSTGSQTGTSVSDQLLNALGGSTGSTDTNTNTNTNTNVSEILSTAANGGTTIAATTSTTTKSTPAFIVPTGAANLLPGIRGDIQLMNNGATILAGQRDTTSNTEVAGFYGSNTFGGQSTGIVASLCQSRPWANGLFSKVIPPTFFDSLCSLRGYQVGMPQQAATTQVKITQTVAKPVAATTSAVTSTVVPKVDIWAVPAKVSLGSRTSIFWNTQGVTSCTETSPDGSFSQSSLSGGASTVPITAATTFTISCIAPDGSPVTDYVTVNLAI